ncbi:MAG TPA: endolytic transglycosylase MltG [Streptosporangiaceae bacterium]|jgi:UPF0755 protein
MSDLGLFDDERREPAPSRRAGTRQGRRRRGRRRRRKSSPLAPLAAVLVIALFLGGVGYIGYSRLRDYLHPPDYTGAGTGEVTVNVHKGDTAIDIGGTLQHADVVKSAAAFRKAVKDRGVGANLTPGFYRMRKRMQAALALTLILNPKSRVQVTVTIREGMRASEVLTELAGKTGIPLRKYRKAAEDPTALGVPKSWHPHGIEGFLYPATYNVEPNATATSVLKQLVDRFDQASDKLGIVHRAHKMHMTPTQVLTVASLAQAEGGTTDDYPKIARVIYNRVKRNDYLRYLQLDTTVLYALGQRRLRVYNKDTQVNSAYNTYKHPGLPPGPISNPGDDAIDGALHPAHGNWYYFVTTDPKRKITKFTNSSKQFEQFKKELYRNIGGG